MTSCSNFENKVERGNESEALTFIKRTIYFFLVF